MAANRVRMLADRWLWLCPLLAILVAALILVVFGVSFWTGLFAAFLMVCPALIFWGAIRLHRHPS
jgi:hypothetical protein